MMPARELASRWGLVMCDASQSAQALMATLPSQQLRWGMLTSLYQRAACIDIPATLHVRSDEIIE
jgi:hypothetical protein